MTFESSSFRSALCGNLDLGRVSDWDGLNKSQGQSESSYLGLWLPEYCFYELK